jgi:hypothetical protein
MELQQQVVLHRDALVLRDYVRATVIYSLLCQRTLHLVLLV